MRLMLVADGDVRYRRWICCSYMYGWNKMRVQKCVRRGFTGFHDSAIGGERQVEDWVELG